MGQVDMELDDVQQQQRWAATEVRAIMLTEQDVRSLRQHHLPTWLECHMRGAVAAPPTAPGVYHLSGCNNVSVNVPVTSLVRLTLSPATRHPAPPV